VHDAALSSTSSLTRDALAKKKLRGERAGALPIGSALAGDGVRLVEHPEERAAVGRMTELRASGRSLRDIAEMLTEEGYPARGSRWHRTTVERVLRRALP
jgi:DNA invertase Pin-like site-specific DNA recombinase